VRVPADTVAEAGVVGSLVLSGAHTGLLAGLVTESDFRDPRYGRMFAALVDYEAPPDSPLPADPGQWMAWTLPRQAAAVTALGAAHSDPAMDAVVVQWCVDRGSYVAGRVVAMAERVVDARRRREAMAMLAEAYNALGEGADLSDAAGLLSSMA